MASLTLRSIGNYNVYVVQFLMFYGVFNLWNPNSIIIFGIY